MLQLSLNTEPHRECRILCLGAHCDDIEIGCAGTVLNLTVARQNLHISWVVFSSTLERKREADDSATAFLAGVAKKTVVIHELRDGYLPYLGGEVKDRFE